MAKKCDCGAALDKHPASGYSESGACLEALRASNVKTACEWPGCVRRTRKVNLGHNFCLEHARLEHSAFMSIVSMEGPSSLNRPLPTIAELHEFVTTKQLPASRRVPVTFATARVRCTDCGGPLIIVNDPDWSPELPNAMSTRDDGSAWGIGICRNCSLPKTDAA